MFNARFNGNDLYSEVASACFNVPYEQCCEFDANGKKNPPEYKERRNNAKPVLLGILYGRGDNSVAEQLNCSIEDAQQLKINLFKRFPEIEKFEKDSLNMARDLGYVTTVCGTKRRLPELQLDEFEFHWTNGASPNTDILDFTELADVSDVVPQNIANKYLVKLKHAKLSQKQYIISEARQNGITIIDNGGKIADATRQCINCVDINTEILTVNGWKRYDEICVDDEIYSLNTNTNLIERDIIKDIHVYNGEFKCYKFKNDKQLDIVCTPEHRFPYAVKSKRSGVNKYDGRISFTVAEKIYQHKCVDYPIFKVADNEFVDNTTYTDDFIQLVGWILTDGSIRKQSNGYACFIYQSKKHTQKEIIGLLNRMGLNIKQTDDLYDIYIPQQPYGTIIGELFPNRILTPEFISSLSQRQAKLLVSTMIKGDGWGDISRGSSTEANIVCRDKTRADMFQYLCFIAGYATCIRVVDNVGQRNYFKNPNGKQLYVECKNVYYLVRVLKRTKLFVYPKDKSICIENRVWCVTTNNETWVARRNGKIFISGNSRIQGSAANLTKLAMIHLNNNVRLKELGFRLLVPIHDEVIAECPIENVKECSMLLASIMSDAAQEILKMPFKCDVEISDRWYGETIDIDTL